MEITEEQIREAAKEINSIPYPASVESNTEKVIHNFTLGAKWMREQLKPEWVPVSERLPETSGPILGCMKDTQDQYICWYKPTKKLFIVYGAGVDPISDMKVTHWMSLPEPPKAV